MPHTVVDDAKLHYTVHGRGAPLLLLMGMGGSGEMWGSDFLDPLARRFRLIIPDNRGTGTSERGRAPYTIVRLADDAAAILDAEGIRSAHVLGVSMGGMAAQELAVRHPARLRGLVLGCTTCGGRRAVWAQGEALDEVGQTGLLGASALVVTPEFLRRHPNRLARLGLRAMAHPTPPATVREQLGAIARFDMSTRLQMINAPTLVVTGDRDLLIPPENARTLVRGIRGATGVLVKGTGLCFFWEAPERAAAAIVDFLAPLSSATAA